MASELENISLKDIIPSSIAGDKNIKSIITAIDPEIQEVSQKIREAFIISRIKELPENVIDLLAWQWHVDFYEPKLPIETKRELVLETIRWHRKKGTKSAIKSALEKLGFVPTIKEWFEPEMGTAPHTFSVIGHYKDDHIDVEFLGPETKEILTRVIELTKPARSKLLHLMIAPIPIDMTKHICRWDVCNWEHVELKNYSLGLLIPDKTIFEDEVITAQNFNQSIRNFSDIQYWDFSAWGMTPMRLLQVGLTSEIGLLVSSEWGNGENAMLFPNLWDHSKWDYISTFPRSFGLTTEQGFFASIDEEELKNQISGLTSCLAIFCDLRPHWDERTWAEHYSCLI